MNFPAKNIGFVVDTNSTVIPMYEKTRPIAYAHFLPILSAMYPIPRDAIHALTRVSYALFPI